MITADHKRVIEERGNLLVLNYNEIPFESKRVFIISDVPANTQRGGHAHKECLQYLCVVKGEIYLRLVEGEKVIGGSVTAGKGVFIDKMVWGEQLFLMQDTVLFVFCSLPYDKNDYITDYQEFLKMTK